MKVSSPIHTGFISRTLFLSLFLVSISSVSVLAADRALLVGVGEYKHTTEQLANLPGINLDIDIMHRVTGMMGFQSDQVKVLQNKEATLANVEHAMRYWLGQAGRKDRVLFYFSGHGTQIPDESGDEADLVDEALCLYNLQPVKINGKNSVVGVLSDDRFNVLLSHLRSENVVVMLDHCHSGTGTKGLDMITGAGNSPYVSKRFYYNGMPSGTESLVQAGTDKGYDTSRHVVLSSCRDDEESVASEQGSLFTRGIYNSLLAAGKKDQAVDLRGLQESVTTFIYSKLDGRERYRRYHPQLHGNPGLIHFPVVSQVVKGEEKRK